MTNYPGTGLDAATEAFNAYKLWGEKLRRLDDEGARKYDQLCSEDRRLKAAKRSGFSVSEVVSEPVLPNRIESEDHHAQD